MTVYPPAEFGYAQAQLLMMFHVPEDRIGHALLEPWRRIVDHGGESQKLHFKALLDPLTERHCSL
jgi:hypothetical protein